MWRPLDVGSTSRRGCHFPPGPIVLFILVVLLVNVPVKAMGMVGNVLSGIVL